jgi:CRP-like cAMP-binding protein
VVTLTDGLLHAVPRAALAALSRSTPRIFPLLLAEAHAELALAQNRAVLFDRAIAEDRLIHLLLDLRARLAVEGVGDGNRFPLLMNQQEIGEATGMTGIYVNRLMGKLVREGRIEVQRPYVRLLDRAYLEGRIAFLDLAPATDPNWAARGGAGGSSTGP